MCHLQYDKFGIEILHTTFMISKDQSKCGTYFILKVIYENTKYIYIIVILI